ncbi:MAG: hypothetical protein HF978_12485 [Desulfobacteraceae bacterium]|nr:hypothetical protein [Desulfobacteraceae bacterium]MBC2756355.1 hypothetical protein [Desulfobacteraceae bacterium]
MKLEKVLLVKIVLTTFLWAGPLLVGPPVLFSFLNIPFPDPSQFIRLLGAAYVALIIVYWCGYREVGSGGSGIVAVRAGVVSNGLATIILFYNGILGNWSNWGILGQLYMWFSAVATLALSVGLVVAYKTRPK